MFKMAQFMVPVPVDKMGICLEVAESVMAEFTVTFNVFGAQVTFRVDEGGLTAGDSMQEKTIPRTPGPDCGTSFIFEGNGAAVQVEPKILKNRGRLIVICWASTVDELP